LGVAAAAHEGHGPVEVLEGVEAAVLEELLGVVALEERLSRLLEVLVVNRGEARTCLTWTKATKSVSSSKYFSTLGSGVLGPTGAATAGDATAAATARARASVRTGCRANMRDTTSGKREAKQLRPGAAGQRRGSEPTPAASRPRRPGRRTGSR